MTVPPKKRVTQEHLDEQFDSQGWEGRLGSYTKAELYNSPTPRKRGQTEGTYTVGYEYYDEEKTRVAVIFYYRNANGKMVGRYRPKALLIDGEWCYV